MIDEKPIKAENRNPCLIMSQSMTTMYVRDKCSKPHFKMRCACSQNRLSLLVIMRLQNISGFLGRAWCKPDWGG